MTKKVVQFHYFDYICPIFPTPMEQTMFTPLYILPSLSYINDHIGLGLFLDFLFSSIDICVCFMLVPCYFYYHSLVVQFDIIQCDISKFVLLSQDCCGHSGSFVVQYKFQGYLFQFCEKCHWYFNRNCVEYIDCFGLYGHFNDVNYSNP